MKKDVKRTKRKPEGNFNYKNIEKKNKNFMYQNMSKSKCFGSNFSRSNFDCVSFRGAHFKTCNFFSCSFNSTEFVGSNLKESKFIDATFENAVFDSAKLVDADFKGANFINTIFYNTDLSVAKNLNLDDENIRVYKEMPVIEMGDDLKESFECAMENKFIKKSRVLDTREGKINFISLMILLENFSEETLVKGLKNMDDFIDRDFYSLSFIIKLINKLKKDEVI